MFTPMEAPVAVAPLQAVWYLLVAVLWIGFFVLEGFDFGAGMLMQVLSRKEPEERRVMVNTVGPMWGANQVWLLTAGGATFAAFPGWYATLFSGLYLPLFLVLVALIVRGISFEYRHFNQESAWKNTFDWLNSAGSFVVMLVFGVGFANFVRGLPVYADSTNGMNEMLIAGDFVHRFLFLFTPFALLGGLMFVAASLAQGTMWLGLKTSGKVLDKAVAFAPKAAWAAAVLMAAFFIWSNIGQAQGNTFLNGFGVALRWIFAILAILGMAAAGWFVMQKRYGISFIASSVGIAMMVASICTSVYGTLGFVIARGPNQGPAALNVATASSSDLTLKLMTIFACILVPIVLLYTIWAFTRFKARLSVSNLPSELAGEKVGAAA